MFGLTTTKKLREYDARIQEQIDLIAEQSAQLDDIKKMSGMYRRRLADVHEAAYHFSDGVDEDGFHEANTGRFDMNLADKREIQKQCVEIFNINPYAKRIIEMMTDFSLGDEVKYHIAEEYQTKLDPIIKRMVRDYDNNFNRNLESEIKELNLLGEKVEPIVVPNGQRVVKFGHVDPRLIKKIDRNPTNGKRFWRVYTEPKSLSEANESYAYGVLQELPSGRLGVDPKQESGKDMAGIEYKGPCFLWQINRLPSQNRGYSELMPMLDVLDLMDQFIFQVAERSLLLYHFIMKITLKGASKDEISNYRPPDPRTSSVFVCNDRVEAEFMTPDLKSTDTEKFVRTITRFSLAGAGIPEHWVVAGDNTNRATAREQSQPIEKRLQRKQGQVKMVLEDRTRYQIEQYMPAASEDEIYDMTEAVKWELPSVSGVDRKLTAEILENTATALVMGVRQIGVDADSAKEAFVKIANEYGLGLREGDTPQQGEFGIEDGVAKLEALKLQLKGENGKGAPAKKEEKNDKDAPKETDAKKGEADAN